MQPIFGFLRGHRVLAICATVLSALAVIQLLRQPAPEDNRIFWANIVWKSVEAGGHLFPHAALMVDAQLEGSNAPALMQLDLGNEPTVLYEYSDFKFGIEARTLHLMSGTIANRRFRNESFRFLDTGGHPTPTARPILLGTLGSSFFNDRILLLDFVRQRVAILGKGSRLPHELLRGVDYLPIAHNKYGNLLVTATINGRVVPNVIFDTGSSMLAMVTGRRNWMQWTSRQDDDPRNSIMRVNSWGRTAVLLGAPLSGTICVGRACADRPTVFFESSGLQNLNFERGSSMGSALVGNVLFDGRFTVIVDLAGQRLGLFYGSLPAPEN